MSKTLTLSFFKVTVKTVNANAHHTQSALSATDLIRHFPFLLILFLL